MLGVAVSVEWMILFLQDKCQDIVIEGMRNRNRALEGDEVAIRLNPESEWKVRETFLCGVGGVHFPSFHLHLLQIAMVSLCLILCLVHFHKFHPTVAGC
jgi:hypothetical protein